MKRWLQSCAVLALWVLLPGAVRAGDDSARDAWYEGDVHVRLQVAGGEGAVLRPGESARLSFEVDEDAYVMVYAIDAEGFVRLLYPRFWQDDGWVEAGRRVRLVDRDLANPIDTWSDGVVYLQAVASPYPFAWRDLGLVTTGPYCSWRRGGRLLRIDYDPVQAFNDINASLFADWDQAVFAADYTYFFVGRYYPHPPYLFDPYAHLYPAGYDPWLRISVRLHWHLDRGRGHCRPVYQPVYVYGGRERQRYEVWQREARARTPWGGDPVRRVDVEGERGVKGRDGHTPRYRDVQREERLDRGGRRDGDGRDKRRDRDETEGRSGDNLERRAIPPSPGPDSDARLEKRRSQRIEAAPSERSRSRSSEERKRTSDVQRSVRHEVPPVPPAGDDRKRRDERQ